MSENEAQQTKTINGNARSRRRRAKRPASREAEILRLAYELRAGGIAERGLGFALTTLGAEPVARALADGEPFGRAARLRAVSSRERDERAAWTILSACRPAAVRRRLEVVGVASKAAGSRADRGSGRRPREVSELRLAAGPASFGECAPQTPLREQLAPVAAALFGTAEAA